MLLGHLNQTFSLLLAADCLPIGPNRRVGGSFFYAQRPQVGMDDSSLHLFRSGDVPMVETEF